ncbi:unnamed protein product [Haemonchus placei]|uniref:Zf-RVT domain-containing protein n=1 Tax=Haemonchus placei TaxID=6290 RepID=A0A0N4WJM5_HAEPC|nr:unnamed protein product [Haemonchus placei]
MALNALRRRNRQQELDFLLKDVYEKIQMDYLDLQEWLRSMGLLALPLCPLCEGSMSPRNDEHHNRRVCHRRSCRTGPSNETKVYVPARKGSFFENSNLAESAVFALSYFWLRDMGILKDTVYELNIGHCSVVQWSSTFAMSAPSTTEGILQLLVGSDVQWRLTERWRREGSTIVVDGNADTSGFLALSREGAVEHFCGWCEGGTLRLCFVLSESI